MWLVLVYVLLGVLLVLSGSTDHLVIVTAHWSEDLAWLKKSKWPVVLCDKEGASETLEFKSRYSCPKIANIGDEAAAYINFIIHNYDNLPDYTAFIHGHEKAWHQHIDIFEELSKGTYLGKSYYSLNKHCRTTDDGPMTAGNPTYDEIMRKWSVLFDGFAKRPGEHITTECGAQFVVARDRILALPKSVYMKWLKYIQDTSQQSVKPGYVFEYMWKLIFDDMDEPVHCLNTSHSDPM